MTSRLCFYHAIGAKPPHPLSILVCSSRSFARARSCSLSQLTPTFPAGEPPHRHCAGELPPRHCPTPSIRIQGQHLAVPSHRCPAPPVPRSGRCYVCPAHHVGSDVGHPHTALWVLPGCAGRMHCACGPAARVSACGQFSK
jgi:hypothetical protein